MPTTSIQTTTQQGAAVVSVKSLFSNEAVKNRFNEILGKNGPSFVSSVISVSNSAALAGATPQTILNAAVVAATLDLRVVPTLGEAYIVGYNNKGVKEAQFQLGYKGLIQLAQRSGLYETINATEIKEGEIVDDDLLTGKMTFKKLDPKARVNAPTIGYAAYFKLLNGFEKTLYMSKEEVDAHAKKYSQSYRNDKYNSSLWSTQFDTMAKKTVLKLLLGVYGPKSVEMHMAQKFDQAVVSRDADLSSIENIDAVEAEYVDNQPDEVVVEPAESPVSKLKAALDKGPEAFKAEKKDELF